MNRPSALLYVLLRHALLAALETGSISAAQQFGGQLFDVVDRDPLIANIADQQHVLRRDYLEVNAARIGLSPTPVAIADWALTHARVLGGVKPVSDPTPRRNPRRDHRPRSATHRTTRARDG